MDEEKKAICVRGKSMMSQKPSPRKCPSRCPPLPPFVKGLCQDGSELSSPQEAERDVSGGCQPDSHQVLLTEFGHLSPCVTPPPLAVAGPPGTGLSCGRGH